MSDSTQKLFSENALKTFALEICGGEEEIFLELLGDCKADLSNHLKNLKESRAATEWKTFNRSAHTLKSTARTFGSPLVTDLAYQLETLSEDGIPEDALPLADEKIMELERATNDFASMLDEIFKDPQKFLS